MLSVWVEVQKRLIEKTKNKKTYMSFTRKLLRIDIVAKIKSIWQIFIVIHGTQNLDQSKGKIRSGEMMELNEV